MTLSTGVLRGRGPVGRLAGGAKRKGDARSVFSMEDIRGRCENVERAFVVFSIIIIIIIIIIIVIHLDVVDDDDGNNAATTRSSSAKSVRFVKRDVVAGASSFNASNKAAAAAITQTNDDDGKEEETTRQKQKLIDVHALKHFCALGVFFTGLLTSRTRYSHTSDTLSTRPLHTENLMVKTFQRCRRCKRRNG